MHLSFAKLLARCIVTNSKNQSTVTIGLVLENVFSTNDGVSAELTFPKLRIIVDNAYYLILSFFDDDVNDRLSVSVCAVNQKIKLAFLLDIFSLKGWRYPSLIHAPDSGHHGYRPVAVPGRVTATGRATFARGDKSGK